MMIPGELEHLESLVKVAWKKKDAETTSTQVSMVSAEPTVRRVCINKAHRSKTLHLSVEINQCVIEGLVDTRASMSVMAASVVRELGLMHLVSGSETYKTASGAITQALDRIEEVLIKVGGVQCRMTFMVVDTDSYDILLGLDLLIKIGAIVDVEQGLIQVRRGPGVDVEILPLTMVNLVQKSRSRSDGRDGGCDRECVSGNPDVMDKIALLCSQGASVQQTMHETESDSDSNESSNEGTQVMDPEEGVSEFVDVEFEDLVNKEGLQQILQLTMHSNTDNVLTEELTDADDYADWIRWATEEEQRMPNLSEAANAVEESVLLQIQQLEITNSSGDIEDRIAKNPKEDTRWGEICQKIRIDPHLEKGMERQLWSVLEQYQDVFAWNKGELGYCTVGEHTIDTQGYPPCNTTPGRLSYWEEAEVNRQINVLIELGKMKPSKSAYAC